MWYFRTRLLAFGAIVWTTVLPRCSLAQVYDPSECGTTSDESFQDACPGFSTPSPLDTTHALVIFVQFPDDTLNPSSPADGPPCVLDSFWAWQGGPPHRPGFADSILADSTQAFGTPKTLPWGSLSHFYFDNSLGKHIIWGEEHLPVFVPSHPKVTYARAGVRDSLNKAVRLPKV